MINSDNRLPLYQRLRDEFFSKIVDHEWKPDAAIPIETELTKVYGVSIGTVRKAVEMLAAEGLLERSQGRGTFVRRPNLNISMFRFFRYKTGGADKVPESRITARTLLEPPKPIAAALGLKKRTKAIRLDRLRLIDGLPVLSEEVWLPYSRFGTLMNIDMDAFGNMLYPFYEERCGQTVASVQETLTIETADTEVAATLGIRSGKAIVVINRVAFDLGRHALEWRCSRGSADSFRYEIEIR